MTAGLHSAFHRSFRGMETQADETMVEVLGGETLSGFVLTAKRN